MQFQKIVLLTDYRGQFYSSLRVSTGGMDIDKILSEFSKAGIPCTVMPYHEINSAQNWSNTLVLYQSSEDNGLHYKSYIADILLHIRESGGELIPDYNQFHAHENKAYQALYSAGKATSTLKIPKSRVFGTFEDVKKVIATLTFPSVLKMSNGCQSKGVTLVKSREEALSKAKKFSSTFSLKDFLRFKAKSIVKEGYIPESSHRNKIVFQEFVPNLSGDYKALVYWDKVFILTRMNRKNDFRASGSGIFSYEENIPTEILDAVLQLRQSFDCPYISIDIAFDHNAKICHLIEFQFLMFGTYTLEKSPFHFSHSEGKWELVKGGSVLEEVFVYSINKHIQR